MFAAHCRAFLLVIGMLSAVVPPFLRTPIGFWAIAYDIVAMKNVYGGRWSGAILRSALIDIVYLCFFGLAMAGLVVAASLLR